jgi:uncharacterized cupredoxin-like copper-binding protein
MGRRVAIGAVAFAVAAVMVPMVLTATPSILAAPAAGPKVLLKAREFLFEPKEITVRAGEITFEIKNEGSIEHNFIIEDSGKKKVAEIAVIDAGKTDDVKATLRSGTHAFACTLPGHREAGMHGTLRVQP